ncbi:MAG: NfeD family protein [Terrimicrobiaceae bacterium]|nr:NfeD family protein [Terrimicrobiaceae bacterium]
MDAILLLAGVGFVLLLTEMFLPGGVLGLLGALALVGAIGLGYARFGALTGTVLLCALGTVTLAGFCAWMAILPRTSVGRRLTLGRTLDAGDTLPASTPLVGIEGIALTPLRPAGKALIAERRVDVVAEGGFIEIHSPIVVIASEGVRVVVRKKA